MQQSNAVKALRIIHSALLIGQILFAAVCAYLVYSNSLVPGAPELNKILQVAALVAAAGGIYGGMFLFKKKLEQIRAMQTGAKEKFDAYRAASLIQWAMMEGPSIFCTICFFLTGNYAFLALVLAIVFVFVMTAPGKLKILLQLQISEAELDGL